MADPIRLRQVCLIVENLEPAIDSLVAVFGLKVCHGRADLTKYGVASTPPAPHQIAFFEKHGLANALLPIGDTFLELVAPLREGTSASRFLTRRGPGGYMVITEVGALEPFQARLAQEGVRVAGAVDYPAYNELQVDPRDAGASMLSFSMQKEGQPLNGHWYPAGPGWREKSVPGFTAIRRAEISAGNPAAVAAKWSNLIGREVRKQGSAFTIPLDASEIRFVPSRSGVDRLTAIELEMTGFDHALVKARKAGLPVRDKTIAIGGIDIREDRSWA